jgi:hypothetical protein
MTITATILLCSLVVFAFQIQSVDAGPQPTISGGDILVALEELEGVPVIVLVDPSDPSDQTLFHELSDIALDMKTDSDGDLIIATETGILRLDPTTGIETVIADVGVDILETPAGMDLNAAGDIIVLDEDGSGNGLVISVNPMNGFQTLLFSDASISGSTDLAVESSGDIIVLNDISLFRVDGITATLLSSNVFEGNERLFINDVGDIFSGGADFVKTDPSTGDSTVLSTDYENIVGMGIDSAGNIIVVDSDLSSIIYSINPMSGEPTLVSSDDLLIGTFGSALEVYPSLAVGPDTDSDGIFNEIDLQPAMFSNDFDDFSLAGGASEGSIVTRGDQDLTITEEANPVGVRVNADITPNPPGITPAIVEFCSAMSSIIFDPGDESIVTCSSVTVTVISGPLSITFFGSDGTEATTSLNEGNTITFNQDDFSFTAPATNIGIVTINVGGIQIMIDPGETNTSQPEVGIINTLQDIVQLGNLFETSATFSDLGPSETHTAEWDWGDQTTSSGVISKNGLSGTVTGAHTYSTTGVYTVTLTVTDNSGDFGSSIFEFVVVYDPSGGFVTGGGWINSPAGAYVAEPSLVGKATFGFVSKYQNGANVPTGNTQFSFKVADLKFKSTEYDWLVVAGNNANFKGAGTIDGQGNYGFLLFGFDSDLNTNDPFEDDKFRIKIWDKNNGDVVVYDNNLGQSESSEPSTILGGGSIVIHTP